MNKHTINLDKPLYFVCVIALIGLSIATMAGWGNPLDARGMTAFIWVLTAGVFALAVPYNRLPNTITK